MVIEQEVLGVLVEEMHDGPWARFPRHNEDINSSSNK